MRTISRLLSLTFSLTVLGAVAASAQVLARPGWAGSGVTVDAWWRRGVFYRIDPATFQDSNGDGIGDIDGITQRLGYLQQLGVDAVILTQPKQGPQLAADDVGTFVRKAAEAHVRVLVELTSTEPAQARAWLNQGIAGLFIDLRSQSTHGAGLAAVVRELRRVTDSFPGGRVLIANGVPPSPEGAQLSVNGNFTSPQPGAAFLRDRLQTSLDEATPTGAPLLELSGLAPAGTGNSAEQAIVERTLATMLLASRAAVLFDAGRELGLRAPEGKAAVMQWTPSNVTRPTPPPEPVPKKPTPPQPEVYGTYTPYVPPAKPVQPIVRPASPAEPVDVPPDPNTLPGFTASEIQGPAALNGATANAAVEESNPNSLLNFYRHLIALHHDNGSLRNGSETLFDRDAVNALAWVRRAPAGSRTSASVVVAANLSDRPVYLSLAEEFTEMHIRGGTLRPLLTASAGENVSGIIPLQSAERLVLQPYSVFLGELYHSGAEEPGAASGRRTKRRSRRH